MDSIGGYKIRDQYALHYLTMTVVGWVDIFSKKYYKEIVIENFKFYKKEGLVICAYVIMSNHIHLICYAKDGSRGLSAFVRDLKKSIAHQSLKFLENPKESRRDWLKMVFAYHAKYNKRNSKYQFWIQNNHPIHLETPSFIRQKLDYIHYNPVKAGIVRNMEDYLYSSASNYRGKSDTILEVEIIDISGSDVGFVRM